MKKFKLIMSVIIVSLILVIGTGCQAQKSDNLQENGTSIPKLSVNTWNNMPSILERVSTGEVTETVINISNANKIVETILGYDLSKFMEGSFDNESIWSDESPVLFRDENGDIITEAVDPVPYKVDSFYNNDSGACYKVTYVGSMNKQFDINYEEKDESILETFRNMPTFEIQLKEYELGNFNINILFHYNSLNSAKWTYIHTDGSDGGENFSICFMKNTDALLPSDSSDSTEKNYELYDEDGVGVKENNDGNTVDAGTTKGKNGRLFDRGSKLPSYSSEIPTKKLIKTIFYEYEDPSNFSAN